MPYSYAPLSSSLPLYSLRSPPLSAPRLVPSQVWLISICRFFCSLLRTMQDPACLLRIEFTASTSRMFIKPFIPSLVLKSATNSPGKCHRKTEEIESLLLAPLQAAVLLPCTAILQCNEHILQARWPKIQQHCGHQPRCLL